MLEAYFGAFRDHPGILEAIPDSINLILTGVSIIT
jgi:hypothetical protein